MKIKSNTKIFSAIAKTICAFLFVFMGSCKKENLCDCFKRTGDDITISREITGFDKILVYDKLDVYLKEDSVFSVKIEGGKNIVKLIKTELNNGTLTIKNDNRCSFTRSYKRKIKVYVSAPHIREITHDGVGTIECENTFTHDTLVYRMFNSGDLKVKVNNKLLLGHSNGMGDLYAEGFSKRHQTNINGESFLHAEKLQTEISDLYMKTSGLSYINVSNELIVIIKQGGDVYYNGNPPVIKKQLDGTGKLIQGY